MSVAANSAKKIMMAKEMSAAKKWRGNIEMKMKVMKKAEMKVAESGEYRREEMVKNTKMKKWRQWRRNRENGENI
jgi:hypothetical protein